jgi:di/tricarboxylate transporter
MKQATSIRESEHRGRLPSWCPKSSSPVNLPWPIPALIPAVRCGWLVTLLALLFVAPTDVVWGAWSAPSVAEAEAVAEVEVVVEAEVALGSAEIQAMDRPAAPVTENSTPTNWAVQIGLLIKDYQAWITLVVVFGILLALMNGNMQPDLLFVGGTAALAALGIISPKEAMSGFSNSGVLTVAALFVVAAGLRDTGILDYIGHGILGPVRSLTAAFFRLAGLTLPLSAFLNNTPIVAMLMPVVIDWCRRNSVSPSKLLIPLSFLTILGGTCTLIGTSTNLVVSGLMEKSVIGRGLGLFELAVIGIPYAIIGVVYLYVVGLRILPDRRELMEQLGESRREYLTEMRVETTCSLHGKTVEESSLRGLPGLFLIEIERAGERLAPVRPDQKILHGDHLIFTGVVNSMVELEKIPGLIPVADPNYDVSPKDQSGRRLWEAVVSPSSPLVGETLRDADFRATYGAAVLAMHRGGQRVAGKLGTVEIRAGDTLLLLAGRHFRRAFRNDPAFYLISDVSEWRPLRRDRAWAAIGIFLTLIVLMSTGWMAIEVSAILAAIAMIACRCITSSDARQSIDWPVLITIAASFGIGTALENSGAAGYVAGGLVGLTEHWGPIAAVAAIYLIVSILTELITNNAAAALMFPFCIATAQQLDCSPLPLVVALALAASASFITPIGYQTNMMVFGPGGYRFSDFLRIGLPLNLLLWITAVILIPWFFPF